MNGSKASITDLCKVLSAGPLDPNVEVSLESLLVILISAQFYVTISSIFFLTSFRSLLDAQLFTSHSHEDCFQHPLVLPVR